MKVIIDENEKIIIDGKEMQENKINSDFLENVVKEGLANNLNIEVKCDESSPLAKLFLDIKNMVKDDSDFRKKLNEIEEEQKQLGENSKDTEE